jgi:predicted RND superfamily exporter protein
MNGNIAWAAGTEGNVIDAGEGDEVMSSATIGVLAAYFAIIFVCLIYFPATTVGVSFLLFLAIGMPLAWLGIRMLFEWWEG